MEILSTEHKIYVGSVGVIIDLVCRDYNYNLLDLSLATETKVVILKPDGYELEKDATVIPNAENTPPTNETLRYVSEIDDLDIVGEYVIQAKLTFGTQIVFSETRAFKVYELYK